MFGLIYSLFVSIGLIGHTAKEIQENEENKVKYRHPDGLTYVDTKGRSRLVSNNEIVVYGMKNGDYVLEKINGTVIKNYSKEQRESQIESNRQKAIINNETTYCIDENTHEKEWIKKGKRFKDLKTGDIYIIRCINYKYYYMRLNDGMLVRKTDYQIAYDERYEQKGYWNFKDVDIVSFNQKQKNVTDQYALYREWEYNSSCNVYK